MGASILIGPGQRGLGRFWRGSQNEKPANLDGVIEELGELLVGADVFVAKGVSLDRRDHLRTKSRLRYKVHADWLINSVQGTPANRVSRSSEHEACLRGITTDVTW